MTVTTEEIREISNAILNQMYEEAEPGLDFDHLKDNPDEYPNDWYSQHTLSGDRQSEILETHTEGVDLNEREHTALVMTCILDMGPAAPEDEL